MLPKGYWTYSKLKEEALKYKHRSDFQKCNRSAYITAYKKGILNDICSHMSYLQIPNGSWNIETCTNEALKYSTRTEFKNGSPGAWDAATNNNWLDDICTHMPIRPSWSKDKCQEEALKYKYRTEFKKESPGAYAASLKNNWIDDICKHMNVIGDKFNRLVYAYEFPDNHVYVGLTCNEERRHLQHTSEHFNVKIKSPVFKHIIKTGRHPIKKILTEGYVNPYKALSLQDKWKYEYKREGWIILGTSKTDRSLGGLKKWYKENCILEALKYTTRSEFCTNANGAYTSALKNGWLDEICSHMKKLKK